jgi:hypothetical protein
MFQFSAQIRKKINAGNLSWKREEFLQLKKIWPALTTHIHIIPRSPPPLFNLCLPELHYYFPKFIRKEVIPMRAEEELVARAKELAEGCIRIARDLREIRLSLCPNPEGCPTMPETDDPLVQMCDEMWNVYQQERPNDR